MTNGVKATVQIQYKYSLTIDEAAEYFGIGQKKLRQLISENQGADFLLEIGSKSQIKRKKFEEFLDGVSSI